ncbi:MAG TPA: GNAT family N-acetyltransferase [Mycobacteriales bacterium]|jgi:GNAT superfamily N-acetyltransferase|nr:GNAT family N-acetyltransferase [Mycobacteriales bacterium]
MGTSLIRLATAGDVPVILSLIRDLAGYEKAGHEVVATESDLAAALFGIDQDGIAPVATCHVAELDGQVVGFALWFCNFSTWLGRPGIYLEDLFVRPQARGHGLGKALLLRLVELARERGYGRVEWSVLDWNEPAIGFYRALGAAPNDEWTTWRLTLDRA